MNNCKDGDKYNGEELVDILVSEQLTRWDCQEAAANALPGCGAAHLFYGLIPRRGNSFLNFSQAKGFCNTSTMVNSRASLILSGSALPVRTTMGSEGSMVLRASRVLMPSISGMWRSRRRAS